MHRRCEIKCGIEIIAESGAQSRFIAFAHRDLINKRGPPAFAIIGEKFRERANFSF